jgi:lysophospholipase L1-like esterase
MGKKRDRGHSAEAKRRRTLGRVAVAAALAVAVIAFGVMVSVQMNRDAANAQRVADAAKYTTPVPIATPELKPIIEMPPAGSTVLFIGDSWVAGEVADPGMGFPQMLSARAGWVPVVDGHPGSGYTRSSRPEQGLLPDHVDALDPAINPALIFLEGGINDVEAELDMPALYTAMNRSVESLQAKYPNAQIVILGPFNRSWPMNAWLRDVANAGANVARSHEVKFVNPVGDSPWINESNIGTVVVAERGHPGNEGHQFLADKLYEAITVPRVVVKTD